MHFRGLDGQNVLRYKTKEEIVITPSQYITSPCLGAPKEVMMLKLFEMGWIDSPDVPVGSTVDLEHRHRQTMPTYDSDGFPRSAQYVHDIDLESLKTKLENDPFPPLPICFSRVDARPVIHVRQADNTFEKAKEVSLYRLDGKATEEYEAGPKRTRIDKETGEEVEIKVIYGYFVYDAERCKVVFRIAERGPDGMGWRLTKHHFKCMLGTKGVCRSNPGRRVIFSDIFPTLSTEPCWRISSDRS